MHPLLRVARATLRAHLEGQPQPDLLDVDSRWREPAGAFVTLRCWDARGQPLRLRGCIGTFERDRPLVETVARMTLAAATNDPRFSPLKADELSRLVIEVSVLSPRRRVRPEEVVVGRDGVCVRRGNQRGVLLPQVAVEHGWDRQTFLEQTCRKAGLPPDSWGDAATEIETFGAQIISEEDQPEES